MGTISEEILGKAAGKKASAGDFVIAPVDYAMSHDGTSVLAVKAFREMGVEKVWDPKRIIIPFDHLVPANNENTALLQKDIREWAKAQGITNLYDVGEGICHQLVPEKGFAMPGKVIVGADSHTCTYGAFGAFATGVGATDMAEVYSSGKLWFRVPETIKVTVDGKLAKGITAKDIILRIIKDVKTDGAAYKAIEFYGEAIRALSIAGRMTICNMAIEMGGKAGIVPPDEKTDDYLRGRAVEPYRPVYAIDAHYCEEFTYDISDISPQVACPIDVDNVHDIEEVEGKDVDQVLIGSCTNGRYEDLESAAMILKGRTVKCRTLIIPASRSVMIDAVDSGVAATLLKAGATICNPGCGPCLGGHMGVLAEGERCMSTTNRNFKGRMGKGSEVYLGSPLTAAATAINGKITDPRRYL
ncbi:3-isopropylmalate dehydratase large subunit [Methanocella sp. CWC-04]|uniref:3-isopropylmalate dehydratase large subunit n=1 Tax=Methanooceanicella nereidis TaxID=2052831 RepID=A0AAP2W839_9EURY|nr:3-isopropylmalate dehydratase large subunit [Methanocella sp. CWC-04]MCD1295691.1 3-isopropylmalate dehydratase large subunit [Methanocella sp. CWC-04]